VTEPFDPSSHDVSAFSCGRPVLDDWLRESAAGALARKVATTFVRTTPGSKAVVAYYSLAGHLILREDLPRTVGHGSPRHVPAVLLARLAVDRSLQGSGAGADLLVDALGRVVAASRPVAARFVVVDALDDDAHRFYEHFGFTSLDGRRLVRKVSAVEKDLHA
jgi:GNAT superfamily N-acetyltransferase